jgi:hypothetical protein
MRIVAAACLAALALAPAGLADADPRLSAITGVPVDCRTAPIPPAEVGWTAGIVHGYYDPGGAQILDHGVEIGRTQRRIVLAPHVCKPLRLVAPDTCKRPRVDCYSHVRQTMRKRAFSWHMLAHEYAHAQGYDHGETTIGADCAAERYYMRPLMVAYGIPPVYAERLWRLARGYCPPG